MIIAPTDISAKAAPGKVAAAKPALLRAFVLGVMFAGACVSASAAGMGDRDRDRDQRDRGDQRDQRDPRERPQPQQQPPQQQPQPAQREAPQQRGEGRQFDPRVYDTRLDEARRQQAQQQQQQQDSNARRGGKLTPDERRELRRQINEAGVDLYPNTPRR